MKEENETFHLPTSFGAIFNRNAITTIWTLKLVTLFLLLLFQIFFLLIPVYSFFVFLFRLRHWKLFCKTAVRQDITKIVNSFYKIGAGFQYSLLNKKVYKLNWNPLQTFI